MNQGILTGGYFTAPNPRFCETFQTLFHHRGWLFRAPTRLILWKLSSGVCQGGLFQYPTPHFFENFLSGFSRGRGYFCAPQALHHRDILLSSRAISMALRKRYSWILCYWRPVASAISRNLFRLRTSPPGGCCDWRVKNCILRKVAFWSHMCDACVG